MNDLQEIHARGVLDNVSYLNDDSFQNLVFSWMKLVYKYTPKKKKDFQKLFAEFRETKLSKYVFDRQGGSFGEREMEFITLANTKVNSKCELKTVSEQMGLFKSELEPFVGGYFKGVPVVVVYIVDAPEKILPLFKPVCYGEVQNQMLADIYELYTDFVQLCDVGDSGAYRAAWNKCFEKKTEAFADEMMGLREERDLLSSNMSFVQRESGLLKRELDRLLHKMYCDTHQHQLQLQEAFRHGQLSCHGFDLRHFR